MSKYRTCGDTTNTEPVVPETRVREGPSYMSLPAKYGIDHMVIGIGTGNISQNQVTIEQEYRSYVTPPYVIQSADPIKFWEVGGSINVG